MNFNDYQKKASEVAIYPSCIVVGSSGEHRVADYIYPALGLVDEAGEVAGKIKKIIRDKHGSILDVKLNIDTEVQDMVTKELGDVLWYIAELAGKFNVSLEDVAKTNIEKLTSRQKRGKLGGSGDNR